MGKSIMAPAWKFFIGYPVLLVFQFGFFSYIYSLSGVIPQKYTKGTSLEVVLRFFYFLSLPIILQVLSIMFFRAMTVFAETLHKEKEPEYLTVSKMALTNTVEQTLIFSLNILAAAALNSVNKERLVIHCLVHVFSRLLFWVLYLIGAQFDFTSLRALGFAMTLLNSSLVFYSNYVAFTGF
jgi:uncharacterized MAPEG superfamily protein